MKTEQELWAEYDRLMEAEDFEAASKILDIIPPLSDEEWRRRLDEAPMDDEPLSADQLRRLDHLDAVLVRPNQVGRATLSAMKTEKELWAEYDRLIEAEDFEAAGKILDIIPPLSDEEWLKKLRAAPLDDEPVSARQRQKLDAIRANLTRSASQQAG